MNGRTSPSNPASGVPSPQPVPSEIDSGACHTYTLCILGEWPGASNIGRVHEIPVQLDAKIADVHCGADWICVVNDHGRAFSLGENANGQLGQGEASTSAASSSNTANCSLLRPLAFPWSPQRRIARLSCGSWHGGFVLESGELFMFGSGAYGQLGTGNRSDCHTPVHVCMTWATLLEGSSTTAQSSGSIPVEIPATLGGTTSSRITIAEHASADHNIFFIDISCGERHTLVLARRKASATSESAPSSSSNTHTSIISFGDGLNGRLGLGHERDSMVGSLITSCALPPSAPANATDRSNLSATSSSSTGTMPSNIVAICAGASHNLALTAFGQAFSWGNGVDGQLGHDAFESEWLPRQIVFFSSANVHISTVCCGSGHSLALSRSGAVYVWGRGKEGQIGRRIDAVATPLQVELPLSSFAHQQRAAASGDSQPLMPMMTAAGGVVVRTIAGKGNGCLALDESDRLFAWGDNTAGNLGLESRSQPMSPQDNKLQSGELAPKQVWYMELRSSGESHHRPGHPAQSRVATFRHQITAVGLAMSRERLEYVQTSNVFTVLAFKTKSVPAIGSTVSTSAVGATMRKKSQAIDPRSVSERSSTAIAPECTTQPTGASWQFSLTEALTPDSIPSRENAYFKLMSSYKVVVQPFTPRRNPRDVDEGIDDGCDCEGGDGDRSRPCSRSGGRDVRLAKEWQRQKHDMSKPVLPPPEVKGLDSWLEKRSGSPTPHQQYWYSFGTAPRFRSTPSKLSEGRDPSYTDTEGCNLDESATQSLTGLRRLETTNRRPEKPKSVFGRTLRSSFSARKSILSASVPIQTPAVSVTPTPPPSRSRSGRSHNPPQQRSHPRPPRGSHSPTHPDAATGSPAPFGSSVASRFGPTWASPTALLGSPLGPDACSLSSPRSPQFSMGGNAEHFSLVISKRLAHARGPTPGPGTYNRRGG
jgi:alpha-tubulin suppressor-like RCC1 family protein